MDNQQCHAGGADIVGITTANEGYDEVKAYVKYKRGFEKRKTGKQ